MDVHRVRRMAETLVVSQLRSGRTDSDPKSWFGRGFIVALVDLGLFLVAFGVADLALGAVGLSAAGLSSTFATFAPLLPLVATAATLIAGVMFELTNSAKFTASDAANWLPITPTEYVAASAVAISYSYTPGIALILGGFLPVALAAGMLPAYLLTAGLAVIGLLEGAVLVEMVRAVAQRTGFAGSGRHTHLAILLRAALLVVLILIFDLAFNPVIVLGFVHEFNAFEYLTALIPLLWSTRALLAWDAGAPYLGLAFAVGQIAFLALLTWIAGGLRSSYWVPTPTDIGELAPVEPRGHPYFTAVGLSGPEAAIASKDLRGFVRRRELLPTLVIPVVLIVLLLVEASTFGGLNSVIWVGWVVGFFSLLLALTAIGQERRSLQALYAYPITGRSVLRAKAASVLVPALVAAIGMPIVVGVVFRFSFAAALGFTLACVASAVVLVFWGLAFAARYSDFQDRPRAQFIRPAATIAALVSGMVILFSILIPAAFAFSSASASEGAIGLSVGAAAVAIGAGAFALLWARAGFDQLFRQLPF